MSNSDDGNNNDDNKKSKESYDVGYKKPPQTTRFKKGQSGNPKGRPKNSKNFSTIILDEAYAEIIITENGQRKKISKAKAAVKQLMNKAASGDPRASQKIIELLLGLEENSQENTAGEFSFGENDKLILSNLMSSFNKSKGGSNDIIPTA